MAGKKKKTKNVKTKRTFPGLMVSDRVELKDVRLINSKSSLTPEATMGKKMYNINYSVKVQKDEKNSYLVVIPEFHLKAYRENKTEKPDIIIDASFMLAYKIDTFKGLTQKGFEQFANLNGIYNAWPYWREFVQNTIARMGLSSLTIPVFRIVEPPKEKVSKEKMREKAISKL